ncbi:hypothetical protein NBRC116583_39250 [Arenicella sp. 4NH20-0111]|uniref:hypothetical protein n=1 Tax=Arenicella sp. 4NH20-0111 TaxID=3127648 RepID=UPI003102D4E2
MKKLLVLALFVLGSIVLADEPASEEDFSLHTLSIGSGIGIYIPTPKTWKPIKSADGRTIKFYSMNPNDPMSFKMTFIENIKQQRFSLDTVADIVAKTAEQYVSSSVEGEINLYSLDTTLGKAVLAGFNDKKYQDVATIPPGEYSSVTTGLVPHSQVLVPLTILSNGTDSKELEMARNVISAFYVLKLPNKASNPTP